MPMDPKPKYLAVARTNCRESGFGEEVGILLAGGQMTYLVVDDSHLHDAIPVDTAPHLTFDAPEGATADEYLVFRKSQIEAHMDVGLGDIWKLRGDPIPATLSAGAPISIGSLDEREALIVALKTENTRLLDAEREARFASFQDHPDFEATLPDGEYFALGSSMGSRPDLVWRDFATHEWHSGPTHLWYVIAKGIPKIGGVALNTIQWLESDGANAAERKAIQEALDNLEDWE